MLNRKWNRIGTVATCFAALLATGIVGCGEKDKKSKDTTVQPKTGDTAAATPAQTEPAKETKPVETPPAQSTETKQPVATEQTPAVAKVEEPAAQPSQPATDTSKEDQRQAVMDAVYANIRLQMEEAITKRKQLLDGGTAPSDEQVRALEGKIMKARELLIENGETVEEVDPPIVQTQP